MTDPWAWLHAEPAADEVDPAAHPVSAILAADAADGARALLEDQSVPLSEIVEAENFAAGAEPATGEWLWLIGGGVRPAGDALQRLLAAAAENPDAALLGPLVLDARRPAGEPLIESCGLTVTPAGRVIPAVESGEPDQGQLASGPVLAVDLGGALVRRDAWLEAAGALAGLPPAVAAVEVGRRVRGAGHAVIAEPAARVSRVSGDAPDRAEERAWELRLAAGGRAWWTRLRLLCGSLLAALGFLLGKDAARARDELRGLGRWLRERDAAAVLAGRTHDSAAVAGLSPTRRQLFVRAVDGAAGRVAESWTAIFRTEPRTSLDELTGDDFAARGRARPLSAVSVAGGLLAVLAVLAGWRLLGDGLLTGAGMLPAPQTWQALLDTWLDPVAGQPAVAGPPWLGTTALAALVTFGRVDWLLTVLFLAVVPVSWLLALRTLRALDVDGPAAVLAASGYALAPVLTGALSGGQPGVLAWTILLPLLAHALAAWAADGRWGSAGATALWLALTVGAVPAAWPLVLLVMLVSARARCLRGLGQVVAVALAGPIGLGQAWWAWGQFPGRYLTGPSPSLGSLEAPEPWPMLLADAGGVGAAPLWVGGAAVGAAWLAAILGLLRRPRQAGPGFAVAGVGLLGALLVTRLIVLVPPGAEARPQAEPWLVLMLGGLALAGARGLAGLSAGVRRRTVDGWRRVAVLALAAVLAAGVATGGFWWAWGGTAELRRTTLDGLPSFVRVSMTSEVPTRTLAIERTGGDAGWSWALLQDDLPRLGQDERGLPGTGGPDGALAASVVYRLLSGSADEQLSADLTRLGVGHVWLRGGEPGLRTAIGNVPGLGVGTGDDQGATWPVPASARAVLVDPQVIPTGTGRTVAAGSAGRHLVLAEPADPRWWATRDGRPLDPVTLPDGRQAFLLGAAGGELRFGLPDRSEVWPRAQLAGLLMLAVLAAPRLRRRP